MSLAFFDTNILIYAYARDDPKAERARLLILGGGVISVQSLNEFANVALRKRQWDWDAIDEALLDLHEVFDPIVALDDVVQTTGIRLAKRYSLSIYDAMIVAAAITSNCDRVYSEDMHNGLVVDNRLTIVNPFNDLD